MTNFMESALALFLVENTARLKPACPHARSQLICPTYSNGTRTNVKSREKCNQSNCVYSFCEIIWTNQKWCDCFWLKNDFERSITGETKRRIMWNFAIDKLENTWINSIRWFQQNKLSKIVGQTVIGKRKIPQQYSFTPNQSQLLYKETYCKQKILHIVTSRKWVKIFQRLTRINYQFAVGGWCLAAGNVSGSRHFITLCTWANCN
jgi:hypothetical protein